MSTAVLPAADAIRVFVATIFPLALMQAKERKDRHYNDDQADQINKTVHTSLRTEAKRRVRAWSTEKRKAGAIVPARMQFLQCNAT